MNQDRSLRKHVCDLLGGGGAHAAFDQVIKGLAPELRGVRPGGLDHSAWEVLEHMRIAQWDILEFSRNPKHVSPEFPDGYWPDSSEPPDAAAWDRSVAGFREDLRAMKALVEDPSADLFERLRWGDGQTILREALVVADHNSYHLGQLVFLRRKLGAWPA